MSIKYGHSFRFAVDNVSGSSSTSHISSKATMFRDNMFTRQCSAISASTKRRCTRNTCIGLGYCWAHLVKHKHLQIRFVNDKVGYGLFAYNGTGNNDVIFHINDTICDYDGERITQEELDNRYGPYTAPYGYTINKSRNIIEDGALHRGIGTMANHTSAKLCNARLSVNKDHTKGILKAHKLIRNGDEILVNYGSDYQFDKQTTFKTRYGLKLKQRTLKQYIH